MRAVSGASVLAILLAVSACASSVPSQSTPLPSPSPTPFALQSQSASPSPDPTLQSPPPYASNIKSPVIGVSYDVSIDVHCGLGRVRFNDILWIPEQGVPSDMYTGGPEVGEDWGTIVLVNRERAVYTTSRGYEVELRPAPPQDPPYVCY